MKRVQDVVTLSRVTCFKIWQHDNITESNIGHSSPMLFVTTDDIVFAVNTFNTQITFIACNYNTFLDCQITVVDRFKEES